MNSSFSAQNNRGIRWNNSFVLYTAYGISNKRITSKMVPFSSLQRKLLASAFLIVSSLLTTKANQHNETTNSVMIENNSPCDLNCRNGGYCSFEKPRPDGIGAFQTEDDFGGHYKKCICKPGFDGASCENVVEECLPPHYKCHNGAPCEKKRGSHELVCD